MSCEECIYYEEYAFPREGDFDEWCEYHSDYCRNIKKCESWRPYVEGGEEKAIKFVENLVKDFKSTITFEQMYYGLYKPRYILMIVELFDDIDVQSFKEELDKIDDFNPSDLYIVISNLADEEIKKEYLRKFD
jgi:hypothetical protein